MWQDRVGSECRGVRLSKDAVVRRYARHSVDSLRPVIVEPSSKRLRIDSRWTSLEKLKDAGSATGYGLGRQIEFAQRMLPLLSPERIVGKF